MTVKKKAQRVKRKPVSMRMQKTVKSICSAVLAGSLSLGLSACGVFGESDPSIDTPLGASASGVSPGRSDRAFSGRLSGADGGVLGGVVLSEEPHASLVARDILEKGGNAVDAATALYFTLSVTYPASASLGGGGICLVHDSEKGTTESVDFLPRQTLSGGEAAIPGNVRGFSLMHARFGRLAWAELVSPAETMAATGFKLTRASAQRLVENAGLLRADPELAASYLNRAGQPLAEHEMVTLPQLAASLALVRARGPAGLYASKEARTFADAAQAVGAGLSAEDLQNYRPTVAISQRVEMDNEYLHLPSAALGAGAFSAQLWQKIAAGNVDALAAARQTAAALGAPGAIPDDMGSTSFVVATGNGDAVACGVTNNGPFGTGKVARGTGIVLAKSPAAPVAGLAGAFLSPVLVTNRFTNNLFFAGASAGGPVATASVQKVLKETLIDGDVPLSNALENAHPGPDPRVQALVCPQGLPRGANECSFGVDPKGAGLGLEAISAGN